MKDLSIRTDLIALKASVDTPQKWRRYGSLIDGLMTVSRGDPERVRVLQKALGSQPGAMTSHPEVMTLFDRAIEAS